MWSCNYLPLQKNLPYAPAVIRPTQTFTFLLEVIILLCVLLSPITSELKRPALWFLPLFTWQVKDGPAAVNTLFAHPCLPFLSSSHHHPSHVGVFPLPVLLLPLPSSPSAAVHSEVGAESEGGEGCFENERLSLNQMKDGLGAEGGKGKGQETASV